MLRLESWLTVDGLSGREVTKFLTEPDDDRYRAWWPGVHLAFHLVRRGATASRLGDVVLMDELIGSRRVRATGEVVEAIPGEVLVWQMLLWAVRLPVRVSLTFRTLGSSVRVHHLIEAGWRGPARVLDPLWRLYFSSSFADAMDWHVYTEFLLLRDLLHGRCLESRSTPEGRQAPPSIALHTGRA